MRDYGARYWLILVVAYDIDDRLCYCTRHERVIGPSTPLSFRLYITIRVFKKNK